MNMSNEAQKLHHIARELSVRTMTNIMDKLIKKILRYVVYTPAYSTARQ